MASASENLNLALRILASEEVDIIFFVEEISNCHNTAVGKVSLAGHYLRKYVV